MKKNPHNSKTSFLKEVLGIKDATVTAGSDTINGDSRTSLKVSCVMAAVSSGSTSSTSSDSDCGLKKEVRLQVLELLHQGTLYVDSDLSQMFLAKHSIEESERCTLFEGGAAGSHKVPTGMCSRDPSRQEWKVQVAPLNSKGNERTPMAKMVPFHIHFDIKVKNCAVSMFTPTY